MSETKKTKSTSAPDQNKKVFVASAEVKGKASQLRMFAIILWVLAIGAEVFAIIQLRSGGATPNMTLLIILIVVTLILALTGAMLWKKAQKLDPPSKANGAEFFFKSQLGAIMMVLAFLPLIVLILMDKDLPAKQKSILGVIAGVALLGGIAGGANWNPESIEDYTDQINQVESLTGSDTVYWISTGDTGYKYHLYEDCQHIKGKEISSGKVGDALEQNKIKDLCETCKNHAEKALGTEGETAPATEEDATHEIDDEAIPEAEEAQDDAA